MTHRRDVEALEDVQHLEGDDALRAGRHLVHVDAAVAGADGLDPVGGVVGQILRGEEAVARLHVGGDGLRDRAGVERVLAVARDEFQAAGQARVGEDLAHHRRRAVGQEGAGRGRILP